MTPRGVTHARPAAERGPRARRAASCWRVFVSRSSAGACAQQRVPHGPSPDPPPPRSSRTEASTAARACLSRASTASLRSHLVPHVLLERLETPDRGFVQRLVLYAASAAFSSSSAMRVTSSASRRLRRRRAKRSAMARSAEPLPSSASIRPASMRRPSCAQRRWRLEQSMTPPTARPRGDGRLRNEHRDAVIAGELDDAASPPSSAATKSSTAVMTPLRAPRSRLATNGTSRRPSEAGSERGGTSAAVDVGADGRAPGSSPGRSSRRDVRNGQCDVVDDHDRRRGVRLRATVASSSSSACTVYQLGSPSRSARSAAAHPRQRRECCAPGAHQRPCPVRIEVVAGSNAGDGIDRVHVLRRPHRRRRAGGGSGARSRRRPRRSLCGRDRLDDRRDYRREGAVHRARLYVVPVTTPRDPDGRRAAWC